MKIVSLTVLHYGREWLEWALRSVGDVVDEMRIFYTPHPSHGHDTRFPCPDSREELHDIASAFPSVVWEDVTDFWHEGQHRDYARHRCTEAGADLIPVLDADEVWDLPDLDDALSQAWDAGEHDVWKSRVKGHFWRSVNWVCRDEAMPDRVIVPARARGYGALGGAGFWHFGYAVSHEIMIYKWRIHGHHNELRPGWYPQKYRDWEPGIGDVHPTCVDFWTPEAFDRNEIAHLIGDHPYYKDELI